MGGSERAVGATRGADDSSSMLQDHVHSGRRQLDQLAERAAGPAAGLAAASAAAQDGRPCDDVDLSQTTVTDALKIDVLLSTSRRFVETAHSHASAAPSTRESAVHYYSLIKSAITCLLVVARRYSHALKPEQMASVQLQLAHLYFSETRNTNLAEDAANKAISIATRNRLASLKFRAEFLVTQILFVGSPKLGWKYLTSKLDEYASVPELAAFRNLLVFLKYRYQSVLDPAHAYPVAESLADELTHHRDLRHLALCQQVSALLYAGNLAQAKDVLDALASETPDEADEVPQLHCMRLFYELWYAIGRNELNASKVAISKLNTFVKAQKARRWDCWNDDGSFVVPVQAMGSVLDYRIDWLSSSECMFMLYFLSGIAYLAKSYDGKAKSERFFEAAGSILESQLLAASEGVSLERFEQTVMRIRYLQVLLGYYTILARFNSGAWEAHPNSKDRALFEFVKLNDEGQFSSQELAIYHKLFPHILYLFGAYHHSRHQFQLAKSYYIRIRSHLKSANVDFAPESRFMSDPILLALLQLDCGVGANTAENRNIHNDLYVFATLNLLVITSWEVKVSEDEESFLVKSQLRKALLSDLENASQSSVVVSDPILETTVQLFRIVFDSARLSENTEAINTRDNVDKISAIMTSPDLISNIVSTFPLLASVLFYISSYCIVDSETKLKNLHTAYHYAKHAKNLKFLSLCSYHIYKVMETGVGQRYSLEEIEDQRMKYLEYFKLYKERFGAPALAAASADQDASSDDASGVYDNEKNDNYYDHTVNDSSVVNTTVTASRP